MTTIYDIAKKAGVSVTTVSRVINNHPYVQEETRLRVKALLKEMHFIPNSNASSLVRKTTNTIAAIIPDVTNNFFTTLLRGIEDKASENGFAVIFGNTDEDIQKERAYIQMFMEHRVDGLIIDPVSSKGHNLKAVIKKEMPLVLVDREIETLALDSITSNNENDTQKLIEYLLGLGHRQIALVSGPQEISVYRQRAKGYQLALQKAGIPIQAELIRIGDKPNKESGIRLTRDLLQQTLRPTAIFAANNFLAIGAAIALKENKIEIPDDMEIVCFDDNDSDSVLNPFFTSINQPAYMMGYMAVDSLLRQMKQKNNEPIKAILESSLCIRNSTGVGPR
jgi:LacI family transcriptional regulator